MSTKQVALRVERVSRNPELNLVFFSFLLNFLWEMWQMPFYEDLTLLPTMEVVRTCTQASFGDGIISLLAFWAAALMVRSRRWHVDRRISAFTVYMLAGVLITIVMEWLATGPLERWQYDATMPQLPWIGTGLLPLAQWLILPIFILALMRRQTREPCCSSSPS